MQLFVSLIIKLVSKCCKPSTLEAEIRVNNIVNLYVKFLSERSSFFLHLDLIKSATALTFQIKQYLG